MSLYSDHRMAFIPSPVYAEMIKNAIFPARVFNKKWLTLLQFLGLFPYKRLSPGEYQVSFLLLSWSFIFAFGMLCCSGFLFSVQSYQTDALLLSVRLSHFSIVVICFAFVLHAFQWRKHGVLFSRLEALLMSRDVPKRDRPWRKKIFDSVDMKFILICVPLVWQLVEALITVTLGEGRSYGGLPFMIFYTLHFSRQSFFTFFINSTFRVLASPLEVTERPDPWTLLDSAVCVSSIWLQTLHARIMKV